MSTLRIILQFWFPPLCGFFFQVWREFILNFFSFCGSVSRVVKGNPEPYFAVGWGIAKQRLRGLSPVRNFFWNYSLNFSSRNFVSAILNICLDLNFFLFSRGICGCVLYFNKRECCFVKNISAYFCVHSFLFYIGKFSVGGHSSYEIKFFFWISEFLYFKYLFYDFIRSIRHCID